MTPKNSLGFISITAILVVFLVLFGVAGLVRTFGSSFFDKLNFFQNTEQKCCLECNRLANPEMKANEIPAKKVIAKAKSCADYAELDKTCQDYFKQNNNRDYQCANNSPEELKVIITPTINPRKPDTGGSLTKLDGLKKKYINTVWSGTIEGSNESSVEPAGWYGTANYTLEIKELRIDFDDPEIANFSMEKLRLPVVGKITYKMAPYRCVVCCNSVSEPFKPSVLDLKLVGQISFDENELDIGFDNKSGEIGMLDTECKDVTCDENATIPQQLDLNDLVDSSFKIKMDGDKINIIGCQVPFIQKVSKCSASGSLNIK